MRVKQKGWPDYELEIRRGEKKDIQVHLCLVNKMHDKTVIQE
jgi:hypothetical protein